MSSVGTARVLALWLLAGACRFDGGGLADDAPHDARPGDSPDSAVEPLLGTGKDGELSVTEPLVINAYAAIVESAGVGATRVSVSTTQGFAAGDLVMLHQAGGLPAELAPSGDASPIELDGLEVGAYQLVRLTDADAGELVLAAPTTASFATGAQAIRIPELTRLIVDEGGALEALPWDGAVGGVIAVVVTGTVTVEGRIDATAAGFRGGGDGTPSGGPSSCVLLDGTAAEGGGALKGEGPVAGGPSSGRGNLGPAGGGGNCHNAGGGGGGNGGRGGAGGGTYAANEPLGGLGGSALVSETAPRLVFGAGGGAGEDNADGNDGRSAGGAGGGIVLVRARAFAGGGEIAASGGAGEDSTKDGGGGGGAGGTIALHAEDGLVLALVAARGGAGGLAGDGGSGGGGGGGRIEIAAGGLSTPLAVTGGAGGTDPNVGAAGQAGVTDVR